MAIDIIVQRGAGDKRGDDIVDPLITAVSVAIARGRNELDERASAMQDVQVETVYRTGVRTGQLAKFLDAQNGVVWYGKITGISHEIADGQISSTLQVRRTTPFYGG